MHGQNGRVQVARLLAENGDPLIDEKLEFDLLVTLVFKPELIAGCDLEERDFYSLRHQTVLRALRRLHDEFGPDGVSDTALRAHLLDSNEYARVGGDDLMVELNGPMPMSTPLPIARLKRLVCKREERAALALAVGGVVDDAAAARSRARLTQIWERLDALNARPRSLADPSKPLCGLKHLGPIAVTGRAVILSLAGHAADYAWQDIAVVGTIVLIAGAPAEGKTTLLFLILVARASMGGPVRLLSRYVAPAPRGKWVVLIEGEHSESSTARKLVKSLRLLDIDDSALDRIIIVARKHVQIGSSEWADVATLVADGLVSDIAIDTIARCAPADANDEREQVAIFDSVMATIERAPDAATKPVVWVIAHTKKNAGSGDLSDVSGSAQRTGQADTVLLVKGTKVDGRTVSSRVTFAKLREDPDEYPLPVEFSIAPGPGGAPALAIGGGAAKDDRPLTDRILDLLASRGPLTQAALMAELKRNGTAVLQAINELTARHRIRASTTLIRGVERKAFELSAPQTPDFSSDRVF